MRCIHLRYPSNSIHDYLLKYFLFKNINLVSKKLFLVNVLNTFFFFKHFWTALFVNIESLNVRMFTTTYKLFNYNRVIYIEVRTQSEFQKTTM